jgi:hypothetical protein
MSHPIIPVLPIEAPPAPVPPLAPRAVAPVPVSPYDAAALVSRMRVEARLPRIVIVGAALGLVCGVVAMWPFVAGTDFLINEMLADDRFSVMSWARLLVPLALVGVLLLLAFYSLRLHVQSGPTAVAAVEDNLRKVRLLLAAGMFASLGSLVAAVDRPADAGQLGLAALYAACCAACGVLVGDVRKGLGEFESREEQARRRTARGFTVELRGAGDPAGPATAVGQLLPLSPQPAQPLPVQPLSLSPADASSRRPPPPLPESPAVAVASSSSALASAGTQAERDLRTMLHLLAAVGIGVYALRTPMLVNNLTRFWVMLTSATPAGRPPGIRPPRGWVPPGAAGGTGTADLTQLLAAAEVVLALAAVAWVVWGVLVLSFGARFRWVMLVMSWVTVAAVCAYMLATFVTYSGEVASMSGGDARGLLMNAINPHLSELVHAIAVWCLLTRQRVKDLFFRGSEAGEGE